MSKQITICNNCGQPLIWTFAFAYAEYFCMNEFSWSEMLGAGHSVDATPELLKTQKLYNKRWGQIRKHLVQSRFYRKDCSKCEAGETHNLHLTDTEKKKAEWAINKLKEYAGVV